MIIFSPKTPEHLLPTGGRFQTRPEDQPSKRPRGRPRKYTEEACPVEIWLAVIAFLCARDVIPLSHTCKYLYSMAEEVGERRQRLGIQQFLSTFINDVDGFRRLMQRMALGGILVRGNRNSFISSRSRRGVRSLRGLHKTWVHVVQNIVHLSSACACKESCCGFPDKNTSHPLYQSTEPINVIDER